VKYSIPYDSSRFIKISIRQVVETLLEAVALVFVVRMAAVVLDLNAPHPLRTGDSL